MGKGWLLWMSSFGGGCVGENIGVSFLLRNQFCLFDKFEVCCV